MNQKGQVGVIIGALIGIVILVIGIVIVNDMLDTTGIGWTSTLTGQVMFYVPVLMGVGALVLAISWAVSR